jgi:hypothetical protein
MLFSFSHDSIDDRRNRTSTVSVADRRIVRTVELICATAATFTTCIEGRRGSDDVRSSWGRSLLFDIVVTGCTYVLLNREIFCGSCAMDLTNFELPIDVNRIIGSLVTCGWVKLRIIVAPYNVKPGLRTNTPASHIMLRRKPRHAATFTLRSV